MNRQEKIKTMGGSAKPRLVCALLAGGRARRYGGQAKGLLDSGQAAALIDRLIGQVTAAGIERIVIVANDAAAYADRGCEVIGDLRRPIGPLGGIEAAVAHFDGTADAVLILPSDLPGLGVDEIRTLATAYAASPEKIAVAATGKDSWQPLCAIVDASLLGRISAAIDRGERRAWELWREIGAAVVDFGQTHAFFNINSPADLRRWQEMTNR